MILRSHALARGMNAAQIDRRVRRRQWVPGAARGTFLLAGHAENPVSVLASVTLGLGSVAWSRSALALWGLVDHPTQPEVAVARRRRKSGVRITHVGDLEALPLTNRRGIRSATLELGLASVARVHPRRELQEIIDEALRQRLTTWPRIEETFASFAKQGRAGSDCINRILTDRAADSAIPLSQWSRDFAAKLIRTGLPRPKMEWRINDEHDRLIAQVDLAYPEHRYAIELDSIKHHFNPGAFETDRRRDSDLSRQGWSVSRFTWRQFSHDWDWIAGTVAARLGATG